MTLIPKPAVFKDGIFWLFCFDLQDMVAVVSLIPFRCAQNAAELPFSQLNSPLALDDNTPSGQLCILPWCRRWSVNDCPSLIWGGGGTFDLSLICQCCLFHFIYFWTFTRDQSWNFSFCPCHRYPHHIWQEVPLGLPELPPRSDSTMLSTPDSWGNSTRHTPHWEIAGPQRGSWGGRERRCRYKNYLLRVFCLSKVTLIAGQSVANRHQHQLMNPLPKISQISTILFKHMFIIWLLAPMNFKLCRKSHWRSACASRARWVQHMSFQSYAGNFCSAAGSWAVLKTETRALSHHGQVSLKSGHRGLQN